MPKTDLPLRQSYVCHITFFHPTHRYLRKVDWSSFVMCLLQVLALTGVFLWQPLTVLNRQTRQAERVINQSIFNMMSMIPSNLKKYIHRVWVGEIFKFVKLVLFLKMYLGGCQAQSSQTAGSLLMPPGRQSKPGKWSEHTSDGFEKPENSTNSDITKKYWPFCRKN